MAFQYSNIEYLQHGSNYYCMQLDVIVTPCIMFRLFTCPPT